MMSQVRSPPAIGNVLATKQVHGREPDGKCCGRRGCKRKREVWKRDGRIGRPLRLSRRLNASRGKSVSAEFSNLTCVHNARVYAKKRPPRQIFELHSRHKSAVEGFG